MIKIVYNIFGIVLLTFCLSCSKEPRKPQNEVVEKPPNICYYSDSLIENKDLTVTIDSVFLINNRGVLYYSVTNNTNHNIFFPSQKISDISTYSVVDTLSIAFSSFQVHMYSNHKKIYPHFRIACFSDEGFQMIDSVKAINDSIKNHIWKNKSILGSTPLPYIKYLWYWDRSNITIPTKKISKTLQIYRNTPTDIFPYFNSSAGFNSLKNKENLQIQLKIRIDSTEIRKNLLQKNLDSLQKENIKIFHGVLYSNKVPLMYKE